MLSTPIFLRFVLLYRSDSGITAPVAAFLSPLDCACYTLWTLPDLDPARLTVHALNETAWNGATDPVPTRDELVARLEAAYRRAMAAALAAVGAPGPRFDA